MGLTDGQGEGAGEGAMGAFRAREAALLPDLGPPVDGQQLQGIKGSSRQAEAGRRNVAQRALRAADASLLCLK